MRFFDWHCHSTYSPLDGLDSPEDLVIRGVEIGLDGLNITDHGNLRGHREMLKAGIKHNFKISLGVEAYLSTSNDRFDTRTKKARDNGLGVYHHLILIAKNDNGLQNLQRIMSKAWNESIYKVRKSEFALVDMDLISEYGDDIMISTACVSGPIAENLALGNDEAADHWARMFVDRFGDDVYVENMVHNSGIHEGLTEKLLKFADDRNMKSIVTTDTHFAREEDLWIEEALLILGTYEQSKKSKPKIIDRDHLNSLDFIEKYNYLYPERPISFEKFDAFLQTGLDLHNKFMQQGIDRPDLFAHTIEMKDKLS